VTSHGLAEASSVPHVFPKTCCMDLMGTCLRGHANVC